MRILLLGATGRTGKFVLQEALNKNHEVNCLVRYPEKLKYLNDKVNVFEGSPADRVMIKKSIQNCQAVISTLNISRKSDFPWSKLITPKMFLSDVMKNIIDIANDSNVNRIVVCSAWGVSETKKDLPFWFRLLMDSSNIGVVYKDHERQEKLLTNSNLNWTIVRPAGLTNSEKSQKVIESYNNTPKPNLMISRKTTAKYMIDALYNDKLINKSPVISAQ